MLQWICPECGRECEPSERDCPVCYPQAEALPVAKPEPRKAPVSEAAAGTRIAAPPPVPPPLPPSLPQQLIPATLTSTTDRLAALRDRDTDAAFAELFESPPALVDMSDLDRAAMELWETPSAPLPLNDPSTSGSVTTDRDGEPEIAENLVPQLEFEALESAAVPESLDVATIQPTPLEPESEALESAPLPLLDSASATADDLVLECLEVVTTQPGALLEPEFEALESGPLPLLDAASATADDLVLECPEVVTTQSSDALPETAEPAALVEPESEALESGPLPLLDAASATADDLVLESLEVVTTQPSDALPETAEAAAPLEPESEVLESGPLPLLDAASATADDLDALPETAQAPATLALPPADGSAANTLEFEALESAGLPPSVAASGDVTTAQLVTLATSSQPGLRSVTVAALKGGAECADLPLLDAESETDGDVATAQLVTLVTSPQPGIRSVTVAALKDGADCAELPLLDAESETDGDVATAQSATLATSTQPDLRSVTVAALNDGANSADTPLLDATAQPATLATSPQPGIRSVTVAALKDGADCAELPLLDATAQPATLATSPQPGIRSATVAALEDGADCAELPLLDATAQPATLATSPQPDLRSVTVADLEDGEDCADLPLSDTALPDWAVEAGARPQPSIPGVVGPGGLIPAVPPPPPMQPANWMPVPAMMPPPPAIYPQHALASVEPEGAHSTPVPPPIPQGMLEPLSTPALFEPEAETSGQETLIPSAVSTATALLDPPSEDEFPTAKYPVPTFAAVPDFPTTPHFPAPSESAPVAEAADPVPAGLTALADKMRAFDDSQRRQSPTLADPIPPQSGRVLFQSEEPFPPGVLRNGSFELREGQLWPLTLPAVADVPVIHPAGRALSASDPDLQWLPLPQEALKPQAPKGTHELEFDPELLRHLEAQEEEEAELRAIDAIGLAPMAMLALNPAPRAAAPPALHKASETVLSMQTGEVALIPSGVDFQIDNALHQRVEAHLAEQKAIQELTAAAAKTAPLLVFVDAASRIPVRRPGAPSSARESMRGFLPWPQIGPVGRPISAFEMEFDVEVLNRIQEWEESQQHHHGDPAPPLSSTELASDQLAAQIADPTPEVDAVSTAAPPAVSFAASDTDKTAVASTEQALVAYGTSALEGVSPEPEVAEEEVVLHALTPIIEVPVPPIAKMTNLPPLRLEPAGAKPAIRQNAPQAEFSEYSPLVPAIGKMVKIIPSPIMNIQHSRVTAPPGWLVTAAIALLIPITALGVVNYWILPAQRTAPAAAATSATAPVPTVSPGGAAAPVAPKPVPSAATVAPNWSKQLEFAGLRLQNSTVKCLVVNHGKDTPLLNLLVTLRSSRGASDPPVGTFRVRLSPLSSGSSREIAEPISFTPPMRSIDWSDLRSDVEILRP